MKRLSDNAIEIVNELHTEKLAYESEYVPIIDALNCLAAYEDIGLEPKKIVFLKNVVDDAFSDKPEFTEHIRELLRAEKDGRLVVLPYKVGDSFFAVRKFCDEHGELEEPAADVVEVRHGKWVHSEIEDDDWGRIFHEWTCSVCGYSVAHNPTGENYCPNCGAEMNKDDGYCYLGELKEGAGNE